MTRCNILRRKTKYVFRKTFRRRPLVFFFFSGIDFLIIFLYTERILFRILHWDELHKPSISCPKWIITQSRLNVEYFFAFVNISFRNLVNNISWFVINGKTKLNFRLVNCPLEFKNNVLFYNEQSFERRLWAKISFFVHHKCQKCRMKNLKTKQCWKQFLRKYNFKKLVFFFKLKYFSGATLFLAVILSYTCMLMLLFFIWTKY